VKAGVCNYETELERHMVVGRYLALASIYRDWCSVAFDETQEDVPIYWIEELDVMPTRTAKVLSVAAAHDVRRFILGAWGCGAFGLDPQMMAAIFRDAFIGPFHGVFDNIVFAVTDWSPEKRFIGPFAKVFGGGRL
jgi:uncharacterized protein (TIGR02452 family)